MIMKKKSIDDNMKEQFRKMLQNVYCMQCRKTVPIEDYEAFPDKGGIIVRGRCGLCGNELTRLIDMK